ncbi:hypothetical protein BURK2_02299 [Burkholderiales bacterium]|nr:hypothetical protein BURK2_02299 [Burkholderiales bacterium]
MLSIDTLTRAEKLELAHTLWRELEQDPAPLDTTPWHGAALDEAQQALCYRNIRLRRRASDRSQ